jgi:MSHA biogenesis protein MshK
MSALPSGAALLLIAVSAATSAYSQTLSDPTRPPSFSESGRDGEPRASVGPVLQSVIVSGGRKLALIDGKTYTVGDKVGEAKLVAISGSEVTLRESGGNKILRLTPDVQKTTAAPKSDLPRTSRTPTRTKGQE